LAFYLSERRQRTNRTIPAKTSIRPIPIQRQEPPARPDPPLALVGSACTRVCTGFETLGRGAPVPSTVRPGVAFRSGVGDAVSLVGPAVCTGAAGVSVRVGVGPPPVGGDVEVGVEVAGPVAVAVPDAGSSVGVDDATVLVGEGVSEGTPGGSVGSWVGGGRVGLVAVGVLVAPVGVIVGMVWFRNPAWAISSSDVPPAAR